MSGRTLSTASSAASTIEDMTSPLVSLSSALPAAIEVEQGGEFVSPGAHGGELVSPAKTTIAIRSTKVIDTLSFLKIFIFSPSA